MRTHRLLSHPCSSEYTTANTSRLSHLDLIEDIPIDLSLSDAVELFLGLQMPPPPPLLSASCSTDAQRPKIDLATHLLPFANLLDALCISYCPNISAVYFDFYLY